MAIFRRIRPPEEAEIPTASMADIAFLLIIFFMTTTIFARDKGLKLVLPEKSTEIVKIKSKNIIKISINDQGQIFVGDKQVTLDQIQPILKERLAKNPKLIILIKTHEKAPYDRMIQVFDQVKQVPEAKRVALGMIKAGG